MIAAQNELRNAVADELAGDPQLDATSIAIAVNGDVVTLAGTVRSLAEKQAAERAVKRVRGVHGVADTLVVELPAEHRRTDAELVAAALNALAWDVTVPDDDLTVTLDDGWLMLEGRVRWQFQKEHAERVVAQLTGVRGMTCRIVVTAPPSEGDVREKIRAAFERSADLDARALAVEIENGVVVLRGPIRSWNERELALRAAYAVPGVTRVENRTFFVQHEGY